MSYLQQHAALDFRGYQKALTKSVYPIRLDLPGSADRFAAGIALAQMGSIDMVRAKAGSSFHCVQQPAKARSADPRLILKMQLSGATSYRHVDRSLQCNGGDIALLSDMEVTEGQQHGAADALVVKLPVASIKATAPGILDELGSVIPTASAAGRLLAITLREVWTMAGFGSLGTSQSIMASLLHLIDASILSARDDGRIANLGLLDDRFQRLRDLVSVRSTDADLAIGLLARELGMSRSTMYETTRAAGTTIESMIREARIEAASIRLSDPSQAHRTITEIAYDVGFKHPSHLSRVFQAHMGKSPSDYRRSALASLKISARNPH